MAPQFRAAITSTSLPTEPWQRCCSCRPSSPSDTPRAQARTPCALERTAALAAVAIALHLSRLTDVVLCCSDVVFCCDDVVFCCDDVVRRRPEMDVHFFAALRAAVASALVPRWSWLIHLFSVPFLSPTKTSHGKHKRARRSERESSRTRSRVQIAVVYKKLALASPAIEFF